MYKEDLLGSIKPKGWKRSFIRLLNSNTFPAHNLKKKKKSKTLLQMVEKD